MKVFSSFNRLWGVVCLLFSLGLFSYSPPSTIHLDMSSKKVPTKRNQIEVIFKAFTDYGSYNGTFLFYAPDSVIISTNYPQSFYFNENGFVGSFILQFQNDGFYRIYGNLYDYELLNSEVPEGYEVDPRLASSVLYLKVVQGNAIEITEKQFRHEIEKDLKEKNEARAWGRVQKEIDYIVQNFEEFGIEEGEFEERLSVVENDLGINLYTDNLDIHQKYLLKESAIKCPYPHCFMIQPCLRYRLEPSLNIPVTIQGKIEYENPTKPIFCNPTTGQCIYEPLKNHTVYVAVRSYVKVLCYPFPPNPPYPLTTIKTIIYEFKTNFKGEISGTIYVAPPFDSGYPYVEYVEVNTERVYYTEAQNEKAYKLVIDYEKTPIRYPNTLVMPAFCLLGGEIITCKDQTFDSNTNLFTFKIVFKESIEPRTFFLNWEEGLEKAALRWEQWRVGDTCYPLRAAWVSNWDQVWQNQEPWNYPHAVFICEVQGSPNCENDELIWGQYFPNPAIYIRLWGTEIDKIMQVKWWNEKPYHEAGHWLFYLMEGKHFYLDNEDMCAGGAFALSMTKEKDKCTYGSYYAESVEAFTEAFAEAHIFEFLFTKETGYGYYEHAHNFQEIDTMCEAPLVQDKCSQDCHNRVCRKCGTQINMGPCVNCTLSCSDSYNSPCVTGAVSEQAALLRDVFDNVNASYYDGDGTGKDEVYKPIWSIFSCLKDYNEFSQKLNMRGFLNLFISKCGIDPQKLNNLANYFNVP